MTGKIFKESANIYEDEAKVLFDYYKKAAEKIVEEEIAVEKKIEETVELKESSVTRQKSHKVKSIVSGVILGLGILGFVLLFFVAQESTFAFISVVVAFVSMITMIVNIVRKGKAKKDFEEFESRIKELNSEKDNIRRDYKVSKLGIAYVPVATRVPFEGKSFVVDHTSTMQNTDFSLSVLKQPMELKTSLMNLESNLDKIPIIEGNLDAEELDTSAYSKSVQSITMHDYMGNVDREVRNISYLLTDSETRSVSIPIVIPQSEHDKFLEEYSTTETNNKPIIKVFETDDFASKLETFTSISELKKELDKNTEGDNSGYFKSLIKKLGDSVQIVSRIKTNSTTNILDYTNSILAAVLKSGYNQYSPQLEAEELSRIRDTNFNYQDCVESYKPFELKESSKLKYDIYNRNWVAEDNTRTIMPFGINQIEEEVLMPLINNLMNETRVERLKIYNNINDQKLTYLNKWHQDVEATFRDNRSLGQDLITQITNAYAEYSTAHNTYLSYKETQNAMKTTGRADIETKEVTSTDESIKEIESKVQSSKEIGDAFQLYMRNLQNDINAASEKFGFVEYFEGSLRDGESKKVADSIMPENLQNLDSRRQKLVPISSYFATYSELPPSPSVEDSLMNDFAVDLQQVAENQISRIDEESSLFTQDAALNNTDEEFETNETLVESESDNQTGSLDSDVSDDEDENQTDSLVSDDSDDEDENQTDSLVSDDSDDEDDI